MGLDAVPDGYGPSAVTIGKFDGVHRGHRAVIDRIHDLAADDDLRSVVVTFDRNPLEAPLQEIVVRMHDDASPAEVATGVDALLGRLHGGARDYEIVVPQALLDQSRETQRLFDLVMGCIAGISHVAPQALKGQP